MRAAAERYCGVVERAPGIDRQEFASGVQVALVGLLDAAGRLPEVEPSNVDLRDGPTLDEWSNRFAAVQEVLGGWSGYWTTHSPTSEEGEPVLLPLADDLADIWRDMKRGLLALDAGAAEDDVIWEWRFGFRTHWGRHATEALRALHARLADL